MHYSSGLQQGTKTQNKYIKKRKKKRESRSRWINLVGCIILPLAHLPRGMFVGPNQDQRKKGLSDLSQSFTRTKKKKKRGVAWKQ